ncbi:MAG: hypothetical protein PUE85_09195, partial [Firmicutes bacterium]|nr:hypothetical protein [Bacillota bacterium]
IKTVVGFLCRLIMTPFLLFFRLLGKAGKAGFHALDTQLRCAYRRKSAARGFGIDPRTLPHDAPK